MSVYNGNLDTPTRSQDCKAHEGPGHSITQWLTQQPLPGCCWFPPWTVLGWQANISPASSRRPGSAPLGDSRSPAASPGNPNVAPGESKQLAHMDMDKETNRCTSRCPGTENGRSIRCTAPARSARPTRTSVRSRMREASYRVGYRAGSNTTSTEPSQIWMVESG